jgi:hypothetical protein
LVDVGSRLLASDPFGVSGAGGDFAIEAGGELYSHKRQARGDVFGVRFGQLSRIVFAIPQMNGNVGLSQDRRSASCDLRVGVEDRGIDFRNSGVDDPLSAWGSSTVVAVRFKGDV